MSGQRARGFTLIEVTIAITVGGLVSLTAAATVASLPDLASSADTRINNTLGAVAVRAQVRDWLVASYLPGDTLPSAEFAGYDGHSFGADVLRFPVMSPDAAHPGPAVLTLAAGQDRNAASGVTAFVQPQRGAPYTLSLAPDAYGLEAQYLYLVSGEPRWYDGWQSRVERPAAVRLWFVGSDLPDLLAVPITVWLGA